MSEDALRGLLKAEKLEPYIRHIRFPQYKTLSAMTQIDFTFPITALVGANGTNKSSLLRALYGSPGENNLGNYWFSTQTDPIDSGKDFPSSFVYGYYNSHNKKIVEVVKQRVHKESDPDYWEPSRRIVRYGMEPFPKTEDSKDPNRLKTRWKNISKNVELIDFRHMLSAFDRYFYYGDLSKEESFKSKKHFIRARSKKIKSALEKGGGRIDFYKKNRIIANENRTLTSKEVENISIIIGRKYEEIKLIRHTFFRLDGYTALIRSSDYQYTEAFAGSGEFAVIMIVTKIMSAPRNSLLLLDEPEVSLHPGAQERLIDFFYEQVKINNHQIVFTTHSPALIRNLPNDAIKVFSYDASKKEIILTGQKSIVEEAFLQIGEPIQDKYTILVEDCLAKELVLRALRVNYPQLLDITKVIFFPGGATVLAQYYLQPYASEGRKNVFCFFDGDQKPTGGKLTIHKIQRAHEDDLAKIVKESFYYNIKFPINSTDTAEEKISQTNSVCRKFLTWCAQYVDYLPGNSNPEEFILSKIGIPMDGNCKEIFLRETRQSLGLCDNEPNPTALDILAEQKRAISKIPTDDEDLRAIAETIKIFCAGG